jgi:hypothetical protein
MMDDTRHPFVVDHCASCGEAVNLECEGVSGVAGYRTHNEYFCPHCRKQNHALTAGAIVAARAALLPAAR